MNAPADKLPAVTRPERIVMTSEVPVMDTGMFDHMQRIAKVLASSSLVPAHLNSVRKVGSQEIEIGPEEALANCFLVVNQAIRWRMDPFAVAQHVFVTQGRIGYEGKLIAGVINSRPEIEKRLTYAYSGEGENRTVVVSATLKGEATPSTVTGTVKDWRTTRNGSPWSNPNQHEQMLAYRGAREWARRWLPEAILGVWGDDELDLFEATAGRIGGGGEETRSGADRLRQAVDKSAGGGSGAAPAADSVEDAHIVSETAKPPAKAEEQAKPPATAETKPADTAPAQPKPATPATGPAASRPETAPPPKPGQAGTPELKARIIAAIKGCKDSDVLSIKRDEANFYKWGKDDIAEIDAAWAEAKGALGIK